MRVEQRRVRAKAQFKIDDLYCLHSLIDQHKLLVEKNRQNGLMIEWGNVWNAIHAESMNMFATDFSFSLMPVVDLTRAIFTNCNFEGTILQGAKFNGCDLQGSTFKNAILGGTMNMNDFRAKPIIFERIHGSCGADLRNTSLFMANFQGANLEGADLRGSKFLGGDFRDVALEHAVVGSVSWFEDFGYWAHPKGIDELKQLFEVDPTPRIDLEGNPYFLIRKCE